MKVRGLTTGILALAVVGAAALASGGDEKKKAAQPAMDEKAMMETWQKASTPGEGHQKLDGLVGTWDTKVTMWMDPGAPPQESAGVSENRWVLGNRYLEQRFEGQFMGGPFSGIGYTGYDNVTKKYVGTWMDTAGTGIMEATGTADPSGKMMTFTGSTNDPMTGKAMAFKEKVTVVDADHHNFESWMAGPDGKMTKTMEIQYTRKK